MKLLAARGNRDKLRELRTIGEEFGITLIDPRTYQKEADLSPPPEVDESETTFLGNARLKARAYGQWAGLPALADDSGLEVDVLGGRPGVHSARYGGEGASDRERWEKLLQEIAEYESRNGQISRAARFRCALVLAYPSGLELCSESSLEGTVLRAPRGVGGFGYDPVIEITELGKTLAEVDFAVTCRVGFRAQAARQLFKQLSES